MNKYWYHSAVIGFVFYGCMSANSHHRHEREQEISQRDADHVKPEDAQMIAKFSEAIQEAMNEESFVEEDPEDQVGILENKDIDSQGLMVEGVGSNFFANTEANSERELDFQATYTKRKLSYIDEILKTSQKKSRGVVANAFKNLDIPQENLSYLLKRTEDNGESSDFAVLVLVRMLLLRPEYKDQIEGALKKYRYWLTKSENHHVYWSENHAIAYLSSHWLVEEQYGFSPDVDALRKRLVHYLSMKIEWGYYEFFSPPYLPYTLASLLNLVDFSKDEQIKRLAMAATDRLLHDLLIPVNNIGTLFSASGRNYSEFLVDAWGNNINQVIYLLTGKGMKVSQSLSGEFLATSSYQPSPQVFEFWDKDLELEWQVAHPFEKIKEINQGLNRTDAILMTWSSGAYLNSKTLGDFFWLINEYNLYKHSNFVKYGGVYAKYLNIFSPLSVLLERVKPLTPLTDGTVLTGAHVKIFKKKNIVLSSLHNYFPGFKGGQQVPWAANLGAVSVWTQAGTVPDLEKLPHALSNTHLPKVKQDGNLLIAAYNPANIVKQFYKEKNLRVWLYWRDFEEEKREGKWLFGRKFDNYIAVANSCAESKNKGVWACGEPQHSWVTIVGNKDMYQDFETFCEMVKNTAVFNVNNKKASFLGKVTGQAKNEFIVEAAFGERQVAIKWVY